MDPKERFKILVEEAEQHWGKWGVQKKIANAMIASEGSVSAWRKTGFTGNQTQLDALSQVLAKEKSSQKYPEHEETISMDGDGKEGFKKGDQGARQKSEHGIAPVISWARGGEGAYYEDQGSNVPRIYVPCKDPNCYVLELEGDSMHPVYLEGDLLVVAPNMERRNKDLVIVRTVEGEVFFKQYFKLDGLLQFVSFNIHHAPRYLKPKEVERISVVHSVIRPLKEKLGSMAVVESEGI